MFFTNFFTSLVFIASLAVSSVQAANTIKAYSNYDCTGSVGNTVNCDNSCHSFSGRHSLKPSGKNDCVQYYTGSGCTGSKIDVFTLNNQCLKVDTGGPVGSFRCYGGSSWCQEV